MSDLIKRADAIKALGEAMPQMSTPDGCGWNDWETHIACEAFADAIKIVEAIPPVDRPQGEWIVSDDKYFHTCQFCNAEVDVSMGTGIFVNNDEVSHMNFCPYCGAKMEGVDE